MNKLAQLHNFLYQQSQSGYTEVYLTLQDYLILSDEFYKNQNPCNTSTIQMYGVTVLLAISVERIDYLTSEWYYRFLLEKFYKNRLMIIEAFNKKRFWIKEKSEHRKATEQWAQAMEDLGRSGSEFAEAIKKLNETLAEELKSQGHYRGKAYDTFQNGAWYGDGYHRRKVMKQMGWDDELTNVKAHGWWKMVKDMEEDPDTVTFSGEHFWRKADVSDDCEPVRGGINTEYYGAPESVDFNSLYDNFQSENNHEYRNVFEDQEYKDGTRPMYTNGETNGFGTNCGEWEPTELYGNNEHVINPKDYSIKLDKLFKSGDPE